MQLLIFIVYTGFHLSILKMLLVICSFHKEKATFKVDVVKIFYCRWQSEHEFVLFVYFSFYFSINRQIHRIEKPTTQRKPVCDLRRNLNKIFCSLMNYSIGTEEEHRE